MVEVGRGKARKANPMSAMITSLLLSKFSTIVMPLIVLGVILATFKRSLRLLGMSVAFAAGAAYVSPTVRWIIASYSEVAANILASIAPVAAGALAAAATLYAILVYILTEDAEKAKAAIPFAIGALIALLTHIVP